MAALTITAASVVASSNATRDSGTAGATLTAGTAYYLGATAGSIVPVADLTTGDYPCLIGMAKSTTLLAVDFQYSGVAL